MKKRIVLEIISEEKTLYKGLVTIVPMYQLRLLVKEENGIEQTVDVLLLEEDYNMIKEKGYYYC